MTRLAFLGEGKGSSDDDHHLIVWVGEREKERRMRKLVTHFSVNRGLSSSEVISSSSQLKPPET